MYRYRSKSKEKIFRSQDKMTLDEAIKHCKEVINDKNICEQCAIEHIQLIEWLLELKQLRKIKCKLYYS